MHGISQAAVDYSVTQKSFAWPLKHNLPFFFCSASDGTNVVKVRCHIAISPQVFHILLLVSVLLMAKLFEDAIRAAVHYKEHAADFVDEVLDLLHDVWFCP